MSDMPTRSVHETGILFASFEKKQGFSAFTITIATITIILNTISTNIATTAATTPAAAIDTIISIPLILTLLLPLLLHLHLHLLLTLLISLLLPLLLTFLLFIPAIAAMLLCCYAAIADVADVADVADIATNSDIADITVSTMAPVFATAMLQTMLWLWLVLSYEKSDTYHTQIHRKMPINCYNIAMAMHTIQDAFTVLLKLICLIHCLYCVL